MSLEYFGVAVWLGLLWLWFCSVCGEFICDRLNGDIKRRKEAEQPGMVITDRITDSMPGMHVASFAHENGQKCKKQAVE